MKTHQFFVLFLSVFIGTGINPTWSQSSVIGGETSQANCSRTAVINYQEVLVDKSSSQKGEGLRVYLDKDPVSKKLLDKYKDNSQIKWQSAALGTVGTGFLVGGMMTNSSAQRKTFMITGATLLLINFLVSSTISYQNEKNLKKAIEEYNQRQSPKILYDPLSSNRAPSREDSYGVSLAKTWSF